MAAAPTASARDIDLTRPYFVSVPPGAHCRFRQLGSVSDGEAVDADENGRVYFFPPPSSWGSQIDVECSTDSTLKHVLVDLTDPSTYAVDTDIAQAAPATSVVPRLTGDLDSIPMSELLKRGYPPRPDRFGDAERYNRWVDIVSTPRVAYHTKFIKALGQRANYFGTVNQIEPAINTWSGRAFDANGWAWHSTDTDFPIRPNANYGARYVQYDTTMTVPPWIRCNSHRDTPPTCATASTTTCQEVEWAGMGGLETRQNLNGSLIQSGIWSVNMNGTPTSSLFVEYAPGDPWIGIPYSFALNEEDTIETWGWTSSDTSCSDINTSSQTPVACFGFYNITQNTYTGYGYYWIEPPGEGSLFYGWTFESIVESQHGSDLADYGYIDFSDHGYAVPGTWRSAFTDPWIYIDSATRSASYITSKSFSSTADAYPYEMTWQCYY